MSVLSMKANPTRKSLSRYKRDTNFIPCAATHIISISGSLTANQIIGTDPLHCHIPWKGMGNRCA